MSRKVTEHTGTFTAHSEDGQEFTVFIFTDYHEGRTSSGPHRVEGLKEMRTSDGEHVNWIEKGKYQVIIGVETLAIFSDDPNAP